MHNLFQKSTHTHSHQECEVSQEKKRGWVIFWVLVFLLIASSFGYGWLHYQSKDTQSNSSQTTLTEEPGAKINQENNSFFWQDKPWLWLEIAFWGWIGTIFYLLSEFYTYYQKDEQEQRFRDLTPWYFITLFRGTFVVFLILLGTTSINLNFGTATSLDFSQIPVEAYVFLSGVLGYFNRTAKEQLKFMVIAIFPGAWSAANKLLISPCSKDLEYGKHTKFSINSLAPVEWSVHPEESGEIIPQKGFEVSYIPSQEVQETKIQQVTIVASLISNPHQTAVAIVTFKSNNSEVDHLEAETASLMLKRFDENNITGKFSYNATQ
jgi:hypothetical protein